MDLTPSTKGYIRILLLIIEKSTCTDDIEWCKNEIIKLGGV